MIYDGTYSQGLVSVIIPTYNRLSMLLEAIASVLAQTYVNWELIIVDDGSTDGTVEAIRNNEDISCQLICLPHTANLGYLLNTGAKKSNGEWLAFLDSDDLWMPGKLEQQIETLKKEKKKWAYGEYEFIDENYRSIYKSPDRFTSFAGPIVEKVVLAQTAITVCSIIIEKKFFNEIGGFSIDPAIRWDTEFILRSALQAEVAVTKNIVMQVRDHSGRSYKTRKYPWERSVLAYKAFLKLKLEKKIKNLARKQLAYLLSEASVQRFAMGYYWVALRQLSHSLWKRDKPRHWLWSLKRGIYAAFKKNTQHSAKKRKAEDVAAYHT